VGVQPPLPPGSGAGRAGSPARPGARGGRAPLPALWAYAVGVFSCSF